MNARPEANPIVSTCITCGCPYTGQQIEAFGACVRCGEPFVPGRESDRREPLDIFSFRQLAATAVAQGNGAIALDLLRDTLPAFLSLFGEQSRAIVALNGECRCASMRRIGAKPAPKEPCPHVRAARALRRAGIDQESITTLQQAIPLRIR